MERTKFGNKRKSQKGNVFKSDALDYLEATRIGNSLLWSEKKSIVGFYILFSINSGLRIGDILSLHHSHLSGKVAGDWISLREKKTSKHRDIQINEKIIVAYGELIKKLGSVDPDSFIFTSQKGSVFAIQRINTILKEVFRGHCKHISSHSLRKSYGRRVYDNNGKSEDALNTLSEIFQHTSLKTTRIYLGIRKEQLGMVNMNL